MYNQHKITSCDYDPKAECPEFEAMMERLLPDADTRKELQKAFGLCLAKEQLPAKKVLMLLVGPKDSGKTTVLNTIVEMLGEYATSVDNSVLREFKRMSATAPVIMISTLNRTGYAKQQGEINFADLKETGALEYNADLLITMVPKCFVDIEPKEGLKDFKMSKHRDIMITCKKSRDSEERDKAMTLYAPGCTFTPYKGEDTHVDTSRGYISKVRKGKSDNPVLPPAGAMNWGNIK